MGTRRMSMQAGEVKSLSIWANTSPCAHICRFCQIGDRSPKRFPLERWQAVVQRFRDWRAERGLDLVVDHGWPGPAFNFNLAQYAKLEEWVQETFTVISLGGVKKRSPLEMRRWLEERKTRGLERIHGVLVGMGDTHDRWVGRRGDFDFLLQAFRTAIEMGLAYSVTLYLTKSTLPVLDDLAGILDRLPRPPAYKHVRQFYYGGYAARHEQERITESDLRSLPAWALPLFLEHFDSRTERAWMDLLSSESPSPRDLHLSVELTKDTIAGFESRSCDELFEELRSRARADIGKLPEEAQLAADFGNPHNERVYGRFEVTRLWSDRFLEASGIEFDRSLLHEHIGARDASPLL